MSLDALAPAENPSSEPRVESSTELSALVARAYEASAPAKEFRAVAFQALLAWLLEHQTVGAASIAAANPGVVRLADDHGRVRRRSDSRRPAGLSEKEAVRIQSALEVDSAVVGEFVSAHLGIPKTAVALAVLRFARDKAGLSGLTIAEIRELARQKLRIGVADGTLRGSLSVAPASQVGRDRDPSGETVYTLMRDGDVALDAAVAKARGRVKGGEPDEGAPAEGG